MKCQSLSALQSAGQLTRTMDALRRLRRPTPFAFQGHNASISYEGIDALAPPVLLLGTVGRALNPSMLRQLRIPPPEDAPFRSGRLIRGWVFADGSSRTFVTSQSIASRVVHRGLVRFVQLAGTPSIARRLRVRTGRDGAALLGSLQALRTLQRRPRSCRFALKAGAWPTLSLHHAALGDFIGEAAHRRGRLCLTLTTSTDQRDAFRTTLERLNRLYDRPLTRRVRLQWQPTAVQHIEPAPGTEARLKQLYTTQHSGFILSARENQMVKQRGAGSTYGELRLSGLGRIFRRVAAQDMAFLDMGSGTGAVVLSAALGFPLRRCDGVELSPTRMAIARSALATLRQQTGRRWSRVHFYEADMLTVDIRHYDIIFLSNLCFGHPFNQRLGEKFDRELRTRTHVFSSSVIPSQRSTAMPMVTAVQMSWNKSARLHHAIWSE